MNEKFEYAYIVRTQEGHRTYWHLDQLGGNIEELKTSSFIDDVLIALNVAGEYGWQYKEKINNDTFLVERKGGR